MQKPKPARETASNIDFSQSAPVKEFENHDFVNCIFPNLSGAVFRDCHFINCNLSNLKTTGSLIQNCLFRDCKLLGVNFSDSKEFGFEVHFESCNLDYTSFDRKKLHKSSFKNCKIHSGNFTEADLSKCRFSNCDLYDTLFSGTNLSTVDLSSCVNMIIDPELNNITKATFSLHSLPGLLQRHAIKVENA